ncbi:hypothetical protein [Marinisporobacter balticus]|uniref:Lipoprotein n=1 Tax=Marinisporobacter balticus TaxID=2018667 RepID=A0A4R2L5X1_9FIRM|nr:hypothetical protein [Marinisporobacter balticus]TCO78038.1 hypothetical protein EV214_105137 [Marinisporobacter balticus]
MKKLLVVILTVAIIFSGCTTQESEQNEKESQESTPVVKEDPQITNEQAEKIMLEYNELLTKGKPYEVLELMDQSIGKLSEEDANEMILELEKVQKQYMAEYTDALFENDYEKQSQLHKIFGSKFNKDKVESIEDENLKSLVVEILKGGYQFVSLEGDFYPTINYQYLKRYIPYLSNDLKDYIDLAAIESTELTFSDGAVAISWDALANRALKAEAYLSKYPEGAMRKEVGELYTMYIGAYINPMYDFETHKLDNTFIDSYKKLISQGEGTVTAEITKEYLIFIEKNDYAESDLVRDESNRLYKKALENLNLGEGSADYNAQ